MSKAIFIAVIVVIAVVLVGYWAYQSQSPADEMAEEVETELIEESMETAKGESFEITLGANPTTGYQWEVGYEPAYLELTKRVYVPAGAVYSDEELENETLEPEEDAIVDEEHIDEIEPPQDTETIVIEEPEATSTDEEPIVGAGGEEHFYFTSKQAGQTTITFSYLRPWETDVEPIKKVVYTLTIIEPSAEEPEESEE